jgi:hypothetical protein
MASRKASGRHGLGYTTMIYRDDEAPAVVSNWLESPPMTRFSPLLQPCAMRLVAQFFLIRRRSALDSSIGPWSLHTARVGRSVVLITIARGGATYAVVSYRLPPAQVPPLPNAIPPPSRLLHHPSVPHHHSQRFFSFLFYPSN